MKFWLFLICVNFAHIPSTVSAQDSAGEDRGNVLRSDGTGEIPKETAGVLDLSYEECSNDGTCEIIIKHVRQTPFTSPWQVVNQEEEFHNTQERTKRWIFGVDNRLRIRPPYTRKYPFSSTVAVSVGDEHFARCSGIALTRRFFLTAAHCLLSPEGNLVPDLKVGILQTDNTLIWTRVTRTRYHVIWKRENERRKKGRKDNRKFRYDYAVLETVSPLEVGTMKIAIVGENNRGKEILKTGKTFIHFSAFDDKIPSILRYRFCRMDKVTRRKIFSKCDTITKTAGAGVYVLMRNKKTKKVERKVIAIETGDYKQISRNDVQYSSALRITRLQFAQICYWVTGNYNKCTDMEFKGGDKRKG